MTPQPKHPTKLVRYLSELPKWKHYDDDDELFIQLLPKVELHIHLDGSFDPDFLWEYMKSHPESLQCFPAETKVPWQPEKPLRVKDMVNGCKTSKDFHNICTCRGYRSLTEMLNCFEVFLPLVRKNLDLLEHLAYDFVRRQFQQNVVYTEVRYSPFLLAEGYGDNDGIAVSGEDVFRAITKGLRRGCSHFGIVVNQIISSINWRPDWAQQSLDLALKYRNDHPCGVVGIDVASGEEHFDSKAYPDLHEPHRQMMLDAKKENFPLTVHAGEIPSIEAAYNVQKAVEEYNAKRIGHGYRVIESPEVMACVRDNNVHFEVCPTSSVETGGWLYDKRDWQKHPCLTMHENDISFSLHSDDPAVFHTSLAWQYRIALAKMGMTREMILKANHDAITAAFCSEEAKDEIRARLRDFSRRGSLKSELLVDPSRSGSGTFTFRSQSDVDVETFTDRVYVSADGNNTEYM